MEECRPDRRMRSEDCHAFNRARRTAPRPGRRRARRPLRRFRVHPAPLAALVLHGIAHGRDPGAHALALDALVSRRARHRRVAAALFRDAFALDAVVARLAADVLARVVGDAVALDAVEARRAVEERAGIVGDAYAADTVMAVLALDQAAGVVGHAVALDAVVTGRAVQPGAQVVGNALSIHAVEPLPASDEVAPVIRYALPVDAVVTVEAANERARVGSVLDTSFAWDTVVTIHAFDKGTINTSGNSIGSYNSRLSGKAECRKQSYDERDGVQHLFGFLCSVILYLC